MLDMTEELITSGCSISGTKSQMMQIYSTAIDFIDIALSADGDMLMVSGVNKTADLAYNISVPIDKVKALLESKP